mmetsp:Transcript_46185/g.75369  ORF Transcript_46185/g.75369 Transcript_46185/m.75369 type:complete len:101 (+) Transcript_46185:468-770(+)
MSTYILISVCLRSAYSVYEKGYCQQALSENAHMILRRLRPLPTGHRDSNRTVVALVGLVSLAFVAKSSVFVEIVLLGGFFASRLISSSTASRMDTSRERS